MPDSGPGSFNICSIADEILARAFWKWMPKKLFRQRIFDSAPYGKLLLSGGATESFIVSSLDKIIGRNIFVNNDFDFCKIQNAVSILGSNFTSTTLIDVGANIGTVCIPSVNRKLFKKAIAIEPDPLNFNILTANVSINDLSDKIVLCNMALGRRDNEELTLELSEDNHGDHRIRVSEVDGEYNELLRKTIRIKSETLDKVVGDVDPNGTLIWLDVQGFEGHVLAGATKALQVRTPLVIEFWPYAMVRSGSYDQLKKCVLSAGYKFIHHINPGPFSLYSEPISEDSLDALYKNVSEAGYFTDLLLT